MDPCQILPAELFFKILTRLNYCDLKSVVLVNKSWQKISEDPNLWNLLKLRIKEKNLSTLASVLKIARLIKLENLAIEGEYDNPDLWEIALRGKHVESLAKTNIKNLTLKNILVMLPPVATEIMTSFICGLSELTLECTVIDKRTINIFFAGLCEVRPQTLKRLTIDSYIKSDCGYRTFVDLTEVSLNFFSVVIKNLKKLHLSQTKILLKQMREMLSVLGHEDSCLEEFEMHIIDFSVIPIQDISKALLRRKRVTLIHVKITADQLNSFLNSIIVERCCFLESVDLVLDCRDFNRVDQELMLGVSLKLLKFTCLPGSLKLLEGFYDDNV